MSACRHRAHTEHARCTSTDERMASNENIRTVESTENKRNGPCTICHSGASKYTCPRCQAKTCCLACVTKHKVQSGCSGVRDKTGYVAIKDFTENHLLSDYRFLEDADRQRYSACTDVKSKPGFLNFRWKLVSKEAYKRNIRLTLLPHHFSKHRENSTSFNKKTKLMMWHVKWIFPQSGRELSDIRLRETITLREALSRYIDPKTADPVIKQRLKTYCMEGPENVQIFLKAEHQPANCVKYHALNLDKTLKDNLTGKCLVEYPTLHVVLPTHAAQYTLLHPEDARNLINVAKQRIDGCTVEEEEGEAVGRGVVEESQPPVQAVS